MVENKWSHISAPHTPPWRRHHKLTYVKYDVEEEEEEEDDDDDNDNNNNNNNNEELFWLFLC